MISMVTWVMLTGKSEGLSFSLIHVVYHLIYITHACKKVKKIHK